MPIKIFTIVSENSFSRLANPVTTAKKRNRFVNDNIISNLNVLYFIISIIKEIKHY